MDKSKNYIIITAGILFLITTSVNIEMPLFKDYAKEAGFGISMVGFAFASYIGGLIPAAVFLGGLPDKIGKTKTLRIALAIAATSILLMIVSPTIKMLFVARILVGIAVALGIATGSSLLVDLFEKNKIENSSNITALSTALGFGGGALMTSIFLHFNFSLTPKSYYIVLGIAILWLLLSFTLPKGNRNKALSFIKPPFFPKGSLHYNLSVGVFWAATGVVIAIIPSQLAKFNLGVWAGLCLFLINGTGALFLPLAKRLKNDVNMFISYILLPIGLSLITIGSYSESFPMILAGCSIIGMVCYGFGYYGTLSAITYISGKEKSRSVAGYLMYGYLGFGIPSVILGLFSEKFGIESSLKYYAVISTILCAFFFYRQLKNKISDSF